MSAKLKAIPGARTFTFTSSDQSWRAQVKQNNAGCEVNVELFGVGGKKAPKFRLEADDWKGVEKVLRRFGGSLTEIGKSLATAALEEPK